MVVVVSHTNTWVAIQMKLIIASWLLMCLTLADASVIGIRNAGGGVCTACTVIAGVNGKDGINGTGIQGPPGPAGPAGPTGATGSAGPAGTNTATAVGSTPNADGVSISGTAITLQPYSAAFPGVTTTSAQTMAGVKTFSVASVHPLGLTIGTLSSTTTLLSTRVVTVNVPTTSIGSGAQVEVTLTATGVVLGDVVSACVPVVAVSSVVIEANILWNCYVSGANLVKLRLSAINAVTHQSRNWKIEITRYA